MNISTRGKTETGALRVWWIPNPPRKPFRLYVDSVETAKGILTVLAEYDLYLGDVIGCNVGGIEVYENEEWLEREEDEE